MPSRWQLTFEACTGTSKYGCQLHPYTAISANPRGEVSFLSPLLPVQCGLVYYTNVRATNCAGLHRIVASEPQYYCCNAPTPGTVRLLDNTGQPVTQLSDGSQADTISWSGFSDICGGVVTYSVRLYADEEAIDPPVFTAEVLASKSSVAIPRPTAFGLAGTILMSVRAANGAGLMSVAVSSIVTVYGTPVVRGSIVIRRPGLQPLVVDAHPGAKTVCVDQTMSSGAFDLDLSSLGSAGSPLRYTIMFAYSNSSGVTMETSPITRSSQSVLSLSYTDVAGVPSGLVTAAACDAVDSCAQTQFNLSFFSKGPYMRRIAVVQEPYLQQNTSFLSLTALIPALQIGSSFGSESAQASDRVDLEACVGTSAHSCQIHPFVAVRGTAAIWESPTLPRQCGSTFFVTMRGTNCAGLQTTTTSEGSKLCCHPPIGGVVRLANEKGDTITYVASLEDAELSKFSITWSDFAEPCSGIDHFVIELHLSLTSNTTIWSSSVAANFSSVILPSNFSLGRFGVAFTVSVRAISRAGLPSAAARATFSLDSSPPLNGTVFSSQSPGRHAGCQNEVQPLGVSWVGFSDDESGIDRVEWSIGTGPMRDDVKPLSIIEDGALGSYVRTWSPERQELTPGMIVFHTLSFFNGAGLATTSVSRSVRIVDSGCAQAVQCLTETDLPAVSASVGAGSRRMSEQMTSIAPVRDVQVGSSGAMHPLFATALLGMLPVQRGRKLESVSLEYSVVATTDMPNVGMQQMRLQVRLSRLGFNSHGAQLVRMQIANNAVVVSFDGTPSDASGMALHRFPLLYWQDSAGRITTIHHHPQEAAFALATKRLLLSYHQLTLPPTSNMRQWQAHETDMYGPALAQYTVSDGLMGRRLYQKRALWTEKTRDRPESVSQSANTTTIVDHGSGFIRRLSVTSRYDSHGAKDHLSSRQLPHDPLRRPGAHQQGRASDILPRTPSSVIWDLLPSATTSRRRRLFNEGHIEEASTLQPPLDFISAGLQHVAREADHNEHRQRAQNEAGKSTIRIATEKLAEGRAKDVELPLDAFTDGSTDELNCYGKWVHTLASISARCLAKEDREETKPCRKTLKDLMTACPSLPIAEKLESVLLSPVCEARKACSAVLNGLVMLEASAAPSEKRISNRALARFLRTEAGKNYNGVPLAVALASVQTPTAELANTLLERLQAVSRERSPLPVRSDSMAESSLLLAAAAVASNVPEDLSHEAGEYADGIAMLVAQNVERAHGMEAADYQNRSSHRRRAVEQWRRGLSHDFREHYSLAKFPMNHKAMKWEVDKMHADGMPLVYEQGMAASAGYRELLQRGEEHFVDSYVDRQLGPAVIHTHLGNALSAAKNLKRRGMPLVATVKKLLDHQHESVQSKAATTLASIDATGATTERALLRKVGRLFAEGGKAHHRTPKVTNATIEALLSRLEATTKRSLSGSGIDEVVRLLMQRPLHHPTKHAHLSMNVHQICVDTCSQECNPFLLETCSKDCTASCERDHQVYDGLRWTLVHSLHARKSEEHHGQVMATLRQAVQRHAWKAHSSYLEHAYAHMRSKEAARDGAVTSTHGRQLVNWDKVDFSTWSPVFLSLAISHSPIGLYDFYGHATLFGDLGGAGFFYAIDAVNQVKIDVGLFSGSLMVNVDNNARVGLEFFNQQIVLLGIAVQFGIAASYNALAFDPRHTWVADKTPAATNSAVSMEAVVMAAAGSSSMADLIGAANRASIEVMYKGAGEFLGGPGAYTPGTHDFTDLNMTLDDLKLKARVGFGFKAPPRPPPVPDWLWELDDDEDCPCPDTHPYCYGAEQSDNANSSGFRYCYSSNTSIFWSGRCRGRCTAHYSIPEEDQNCECPEGHTYCWGIHNGDLTPGINRATYRWCYDLAGVGASVTSGGNNKWTFASLTAEHSDTCPGTCHSDYVPPTPSGVGLCALHASLDDMNSELRSFNQHEAGGSIVPGVNSYMEIVNTTFASYGRLLNAFTHGIDRAGSIATVLLPTGDDPITGLPLNGTGVPALREALQQFATHTDNFVVTGAAAVNGRHRLNDLVTNASAKSMSLLCMAAQDCKAFFELASSDEGRARLLSATPQGPTRSVSAEITALEGALTTMNDISDTPDSLLSSRLHLALAAAVPGSNVAFNATDAMVAILGDAATVTTELNPHGLEWVALALAAWRDGDSALLVDTLSAARLSGSYDAFIAKEEFEKGSQAVAIRKIAETVDDGTSTGAVASAALLAVALSEAGYYIEEASTPHASILAPFSAFFARLAEFRAEAASVTLRSQELTGMGALLRGALQALSLTASKIGAEPPVRALFASASAAPIQGDNLNFIGLCAPVRNALEESGIADIATPQILRAVRNRRWTKANELIRAMPWCSANRNLCTDATSVVAQACSRLPALKHC